MYDRVLADVPCSGDGTLRKNPAAWHTFDPLHGVALHDTQARILLRGYAQLAPGGRLVYSTCSFDPLQNEAVVLSLLVRAHTSLQAGFSRVPDSLSAPARPAERSASSRRRGWCQRHRWPGLFRGPG